MPTVDHGPFLSALRLLTGMVATVLTRLPLQHREPQLQRGDLGLTPGA